MHELAVTSGFAAAYRLGADYPFHGDEDCERLFRLYLMLSHGVRMVRDLLRIVFSCGGLKLHHSSGRRIGRGCSREVASLSLNTVTVFRYIRRSTTRTHAVGH